MLVKKLIGARHTSLIAFLEALTVAIVVWIANDQTRTVRMVISEQADLCIAGCLPSFSSLLDVLNVLLIHAENVGESFEILFTYLSGFVLGIDQEWTGYQVIPGVKLKWLKNIQMVDLLIHLVYLVFDVMLFQRGQSSAIWTVADMPSACLKG